MKVFLLLVFLSVSATLQARHLIGCGPAFISATLPMSDILTSSADQYLAGACYLRQNPTTGENRWFPDLPELQGLSAIPSEFSEAGADAQFQQFGIRLPIKRLQQLQLAFVADYQQQRLKSELKENTYWSRTQQVIAKGQNLFIERQQLRYGIDLTLLDAQQPLNTLRIAYEQNKQPVHIQQQQPGEVEVLTPALFNITQVSGGYQGHHWGWNLNWLVSIGYGYLRDNGVTLFKDSGQDSRFNQVRLDISALYRWRFSQRFSASLGISSQAEYFNFSHQAYTERYQFNNSSALLYQLQSGIEWFF